MPDLEKRKAALVAIGADPPEQAKNLASKLNLSFPVLSDPERNVIKRYGVDDAENEIAWPALFVIGPGGKIVHRQMLESYKERPLPKTVLEAIDEAAKP